MTVSLIAVLTLDVDASQLGALPRGGAGTDPAAIAVRRRVGSPGLDHLDLAIPVTHKVVDPALPSIPVDGISAMEFRRGDFSIDTWKTTLRPR